jgi:hypothetical protein
VTEPGAPVEAFLAEAYVSGTYEGTTAELHGLLDGGLVVELTDVALIPIARLTDGTAEHSPTGSIAADEVLLAALPHDPDAPHIHRVYYTVDLTVGAYTVTGEMAMLPGFDPDRALTRPASDFIDLREAEVRIATPAGEVEQAYEHLVVNRFAVERVACDIDVTFWFPGATQELPPEE